MNLSTAQIGHILLALGLLLISAHSFGYLFRRFRQPPVIGEILGGLALGPTLLGHFFPAAQAAVFSGSGPTATVLGAVYQLGLILLMFCSGNEIRSLWQAGSRRTILSITLAGTLIPFALGFVFAGMFDLSGHHGPAGNRLAFTLVFCIGVAVTSIPVIARILSDLGLLDTPFARVVLSAAVLEDIALYVVLAIALSMVQAPGQEYGLPHMLDLRGDSAFGLGYHVVVTTLFLGAALAIGPAVYAWAERNRFNLPRRSSQTAHLLIILFGMTGAAILLGIPPMFGAFVAGIFTSAAQPGQERASESIRTFSFAFFIPVYFAIVGLKLDLVRAFDPLFFVLFLAGASAVKLLSVYAGARLAAESRWSSLNLAVAMNARGGPGILLASLAADAGIINSGFFAVLVLLSLCTSFMAGSWLQHVCLEGRSAADVVRGVQPES